MTTRSLLAMLSHRFTRIALCLVAMVAVTSGSPRADAAELKTKKRDQMRVYVGTYTQGDSKGIYAFQLDLTTGKASEPRLVAELDSPSFLAIHPNGQLLYAVNELDKFAEQKTGAVSALSIDSASGQLTLLNQQPSAGLNPCHLIVDYAGRNVLCANYSSGTVSVLPLEDDGRLKPASSVIQHAGSSKTKRQSQAHAHSINLDKSGKYALAADLGIDQMITYKFDPKAGTLTPHSVARLKPGSGPRHFAFHPSGQYAYAINELASTVTAFRYTADQGKLDTIQTISSLPADYDGKSYTAEVQVHPSGKFLYGSNRGHDSIAVYAINQSTGQLTLTQIQPTGGRTPRGFGIDPSGRYLLAANQSTDDIHILKISPDDGRLTPTGNVVKVATPVCVKMLAVEK